MTQRIAFRAVAVFVCVVFAAATPLQLFAQRGRGGSGGGGGGGFRGGGGSMSRGGFSGGNVGGGRSSGSFGGGSPGGMRSSPAISRGSMGSIRTGPSLGSFRTPSGMNSLRSTPSLSGNSFRSPANPGSIRISPNSNVRIPGANPGSSFNRSPGARLPGSGSAGRPNPGIPSSRSPDGSLRNNAPGNLGRISTNGLNLGSRPNPGNPQTTLRPNSTQRLNSIASGGAGRSNPGRVNTSPGNIRFSSANRVTPQNLNNFLSLRNSPPGVRPGGSQYMGLARSGGQRPWRNLNVTQVNFINTNINNVFRGYHGYGFHRGYGLNGFGFGYRTPYWNNWAFGVRSFWNPYGYYGLFTPRFWATNYAYFPWRRSYYWWGGGYPSSYWWNTPTWIGLNSWFPNYGWTSPYYYGYGPGGNILLDNGNVYIDDQPVATVEDYAASAADLATVPTPANPDQPTQWLPLGTFALSEGESDTNPQRVIQLAVDKEGVVSGTMVNRSTNQVFPIQGRVDKDTQRVAFTIGDAKDVVFETGVFNLTQQQTPVLVHGDAQHETYLMLRLEQPPASGSARGSDSAVSPSDSTPAVRPVPPPPAPGIDGLSPGDPEIVPPAPSRATSR